MKKRILLTTMLAILISSPSKGDLLKRIAERYARFSSISGEFEQKVTFSDGRTKTFEGNFTIGDDRSKWVYYPPNEQTVITKGDRVYIYDPFSGQVQEGKLEFPLIYNRLFSDPERLKEFFRIEEEKGRLVMIPKRESQVKRIVVVLDRDLEIKGVCITDSMDNRTCITFKRVKVKRNAR